MVYSKHGSKKENNNKKTETKEFEKNVMISDSVDKFLNNVVQGTRRIVDKEIIEYIKEGKFNNKQYLEALGFKLKVIKNKNGYRVDYLLMNPNNTIAFQAFSTRRPARDDKILGFELAGRNNNIIAIYIQRALKPYEIGKVFNLDTL